jgi:hypothetical protein
MDGGVANNTPISHAVELGARRIYVLPTRHACALAAQPRGALGMALHAISLLTHRRLIDDNERHRADAQPDRAAPTLSAQHHPDRVRPCRRADRARARGRSGVSRLGGKTRLAGVANPAMTSDRTSYDTRAELGAVVGWRRARLVAAGFASELAARLARDCRIDLHAVLELVDRGCPPVLAARILAPLDDDSRPC